MTGNTPPPGSTDAIEQGCKCPVIDNGRGRGRFGDGEQYVYNLECPVHKRGVGDE